ncbi:MAG: hypothetical protein ACLQQB_04290 [Solirubrobacteraceae bacterium]
MPKMVHLKGVGYVRAGSWSTKPVPDKWRLIQKQLEDAAMLMVRRLDHLLFEEKTDYSQAIREAYEQTIIWQLKDLHGQIEKVLAKFPKERRAKALEEVTGRTPEEAAAFKAKAKDIREAMSS